MCGIAGVVQFRSDSHVDPENVERMCRAIVHRGPDDDGIYVQGRVGLGMRRLSIVDLATGHQPISNEDGTVWIVFNGEIYNHLAVREQLQARGHRYATNSDTETVVHAYEEYGRDCVHHLRGMFAFAIWDTRQRRLFIARDRLGIKPLYYRITLENFLFGSEVKAILAYPGVHPAFHRAGLPEYLAFGYLSGEETLYAGISKLMPGHTLELEEDATLRIQSYWDLPQHEQDKVEDKPESYYIQSYRELLEEAVSSHLMSDVPLGVFLSGGIDSSVVAALMTKIRRAPVETFSVGYEEETYSELSYARQVARHLNSVHHEVRLGQQEFFDLLPKLIWHEDEPIVWPSSVALYCVARLARDRVKVVLTGEGSDETLAGYSRYAFTLKNISMNRVYKNIFPRVIRRSIQRSIAGSPWMHATLRRKLSHTFLAHDVDSCSSFYFDNFFSAFSEKDQADLLSEDFIRESRAGAAYENVLEYWEHSSGELVQRLLYTDIKTYLVELLMKQDNMSMAVSIESRVPFLDHVLVEFASRIPQRHLIKGLAGKRILKKGVEDLLPHSILYRPKLGFPTPWSSWLAGPQLNVIQDMLLEPRTLNRGLFKRAAVERLFNEHRAHYRDHYDRIWRLLNLELWHRVCLEGEDYEPMATSSQDPSFLSTA